MSVLGGVGYPDFTRVPQQEGPAIVRQDAGTVFNATTLFGPFYVGIWRWLRVRWRPNPFGAAVYRIDVFFYEDQATTKQLAVRSFEFAFDAFFHQCIPIGGPWCVIQYEKVGAPSTTSELIVQPLQVRDSIPQETDLQMTIQLASVSVGAGVTTSFNGLAVVQGLASWDVNTTATVWQARLQGLDSGGNVWDLGRQSSTVGVTNQPLLVGMPGITHRLQVTNSDAAAKLFSATLTFMGQVGVA
ncbi:MAG TPA: hypothetical protein VIV12_01535 [Streptosporangiaceae bacterium]